VTSSYSTDGTTATFDVLSPGTRHCYTVYAIKSTSSSPPSVDICFWTFP
jgi:hypothetical protein